MEQKQQQQFVEETAPPSPPPAVNFGQAIYGRTKYGGDMLLYDSRIHPGKRYEFTVARKYHDKKGQLHLHFTCLRCRALRPPVVPMIACRSGWILNDPDMPPNGPHVCQPIDLAASLAKQIDREARQSLREGLCTHPKQAFRAAADFIKQKFENCEPSLREAIEHNFPDYNRVRRAYERNARSASKRQQQMQLQQEQQQQFYPEDQQQNGEEGDDGECSSSSSSFLEHHNNNPMGMLNQMLALAEEGGPNNNVAEESKLSDEEKMYLIELIRAHPKIWNPKCFEHSRYVACESKRNAYEKIARQMSEHFGREMSADQMKMSWRFLQIYFRRILKEQSARPAGDSGICWRFFEPMQFLLTDEGPSTSTSKHHSDIPKKQNVQQQLDETICEEFLDDDYGTGMSSAAETDLDTAHRSELFRLLKDDQGEPGKQEPAEQQNNVPHQPSSSIAFDAMSNALSSSSQLLTKMVVANNNDGRSNINYDNHRRKYVIAGMPSMVKNYDSRHTSTRGWTVWPGSSSSSAKRPRTCVDGEVEGSAAGGSARLDSDVLDPNQMAALLNKNDNSNGGMAPSTFSLGLQVANTHRKLLDQGLDAMALEFQESLMNSVFSFERRALQQRQGGSSWRIATSSSTAQNQQQKQHQ